MLAVYRAELLENVVPFWQRHGIDSEYGGYFTCLDRRGEVYSTDKYMWLQGRAVWMFARLHRTVDASRGWLDLAAQGADFIRRHGREPGGRVAFALTRDGRPMHVQRKIYSEVFYVMAMAEMAAATGQEAYLDEARATFWQTWELWNHPERLGRPILSGTPRGTTLADPMVFLGMIEDLAPLGDDSRYGEVIERMLAIIARHIRPDRRLVLENVGLDGEALDGPAGRLLSPGHAIELAWFLIHLARRTGRDDLIATAIDVMDFSFDRGWDPQYGGLFYFLDAEGRPPTHLEWSMKLWWPMTEALYATLLAWTLTGDQRHLRRHDLVRQWSWDHLRDAEHGEWYGYLDRRGEPTNELKGGPWKGFFHLPRALLYCVDLLAARDAAPSGT
ncbi:MAG: N-acylglucosamine 2-epimerase [Planctomycetes bacterium]|nr:N-acylglucosamine 2-epimerase [Planctomycetota bacterium]